MWPSYGRENPDHREDDQARQAEIEPAHGLHADQRGKKGQHHQNAAEQDELVIGAECADGKVLQARRGEADRDLLHRDHRRGAGAHDPGHQLSDPDRDRGGQQADDGTKPSAAGVSINDHDVNSAPNPPRIGPPGPGWLRYLHNSPSRTLIGYEFRLWA